LPVRIIMMGLRMNGCNLPGSVLANLYIRIRDEIDSDDRSLDPNHVLRAPIAMAILTAAKVVGPNIVGIEVFARKMLTQTARTEPVARSESVAA
jgi:hypothetical protein